MASNLRKQLGLDKPKPPTPAAAPPKAKKTPAAQADAKLVVTRSCGCKIGVRHLEQSPCPACVRRNRRKRPPRRQAPDRLPDNASFSVVYDAAAVSWAGTLSVDGKVFEGQSSAVFHLLALLDKKYRDSLG
jgi:hypothetical protein